MNIKFNVLPLCGILFITQLFILNSCTTPKQVQATPSPAVVSERSENKTTEVLTAILKATQDSSTGKISFEIHKLIKAEGYFKNIKKKKRPGDFKAVIEGENGSIVDSIFFENPLARRVESSEEDGQLTSVIVKKNEEYVSIRINNKGKDYTLSIFDDTGLKISSHKLDK